MSDSSKEGLLKRWSRLKRQSAAGNEADGLSTTRGATEQAATGSARTGSTRTGSTHVASAQTGDAVGSTAVAAVAESVPAAVTDSGDDDKPAQQALPVLPPLDELDPESDFVAFMDPRVDDQVRRAALKTLFRDPDFNVADGLDVYAEDYTKLEKLTPAMVAALRYAQRTLFGQDTGREVENATGNNTDPAGAEHVLAAETRGGSEAAEVPAEVEANEPDKAEANMSAAELQQPLPDSQHTQSDKN